MLEIDGSEQACLFLLFFPLDLVPASIAKEGSQGKSWTWPGG